MKNCRIIVSIVLLLAMLVSPALAYEELVKGSKGEAVVELQNRLNELGYSVGSADGDFGNKTYKAVIDFQINNQLTITGIADAGTQTMLFSNIAENQGFKSSKYDLVDDFDNLLGACNSGITRSGYYEDTICVAIDNSGNGFLMVELGEKCPFWSFDYTTSEWKEICALLYRYNKAFDGCLYINEYSGEAICFKTSRNNYNNEPLTERIFKETEISEYLKLISEKTKPHLKNNDKPIATPKPTAAPTSKPSTSNSDWAAVGEALKNIDANGDGYISMDEIFE